MQRTMRFTPRYVALSSALLAAVPAGAPRPARACDICAVYTATEQSESRAGPRLGVATQYTHYGTLQDGSEPVPNPFGQRLNSVITQVVLGWQLVPRLGVQVNLPFIYRDFRRVENGRAADGNVGGLGDMSILANVLAYSTVREHGLFRLNLLGGLKLPTGDSSRLGEELEEDDHSHASVGASGASTLRPRHTGGAGAATGTENAVHGHDIALGSGSVDGIVGGDMLLTYRRVYFSGLLQYAIRREGSFDYRYANDFAFESGPGVWLWLGHEGTLAVQAVLSGETKGNDTLAGVPADDTAVTTLYLGPRLTGTWGTSWSAEIAGDLPVLRHNTALQVVPDHRIRAAAVWRF
jgi:hypothetical protein